ncbi:hypothetical protein ILUMI_16282 [Ignelater luminosus]|uniref:FHA domain-containing protein n=1 Tax=Ignelater luminosus TaxID=2038154 RepID=A0A8K0G8P9_IGNLU|nr:hypothetical protein ILUMI_16282 [Ignelater luminosus]
MENYKWHFPQWHLQTVRENYSRKKTFFKYQSSELGIRALLCPVVSKRFYNVWSPETQSCIIGNNVSSKGHLSVRNPSLPVAIPMKYRNFSIGIGGPNDAQLELYGKCNYMSIKHAEIYYDDFEHLFQLLNYSCYGTYVDNVFAANNEMKPNPNRARCESKKFRIDPAQKCVVRSHACECVPSTVEKLNQGWEGSLIVGHGSVLRFGCVKFIFLVIDHSLIVT